MWHDPPPRTPVAPPPAIDRLHRGAEVHGHRRGTRTASPEPRVPDGRAIRPASWPGPGATCTRPSLVTDGPGLADLGHARSMGRRGHHPTTPADGACRPTLRRRVTR